MYGNIYGGGQQAMDVEDMRQYIRGFSLSNCAHGSQGYRRVLLQLFGFLGHGKSCFINSCKFVVDDATFRVYAKVAPSIHNAETMVRYTYPLTQTITLVDNRGFSKMDSVEAAEMYAQLGNFLPLGKVVDFSGGFREMLEKILEADREDRSMDFIVPILIYSTVKGVAEQEVEEFTKVLLKARDITGLFPAVVLTNELSGNLPDVMEKFRRMGVKLMFPLENYTEEDHVKIRKKHEIILKCLYEIIKDVEFRMREIRDPVGEKIERKKIILNFIHEKEMERKKEEDDRAMMQQAIRQRDNQPQPIAASFQIVEVPPDHENKCCLCLKKFFCCKCC